MQTVLFTFDSHIASLENIFVQFSKEREIAQVSIDASLSVGPSPTLNPTLIYSLIVCVYVCLYVCQQFGRLCE